MSIFKLLLNIAVIYLLFQAVKLVISLQKTSKNINDQFDNIKKQMKKETPQKPNDTKLDGDYVDYEEIK